MSQGPQVPPPPPSYGVPPSPLWVLGWATPSLPPVGFGLANKDQEGNLGKSTGYCASCCLKL